MLKQLLIVTAAAMALSTAAFAAGTGDASGGKPAATSSGSSDEKTEVKPGQGQGPTEATGQNVPAAQKPAPAEETATQQGDKTTIHPGGEKK